jgi:hypothetical protein
MNGREFIFMRKIKRISLIVPAVVGVAALVLVVGLPSIAFSDSDNGRFAATLTSFGETPTLSTAGHGSLRLQLNSQSMDYTLTFADISANVLFAHLHLGEPALAGGVFAFLCGGGGKPACTSPVSGTIAASDILTPMTGSPAVPQVSPVPFTLDAAERAIRAGAVYANVHSTNFPAGEIRGQVTGANERNGGQGQTD